MELENRALKKAYREMDVAEPPAPWRHVPCGVSGVTAVGFGTNSEHLLVLSHSGLGVVDCSTGAIVAREFEAEDLVDDPYPLQAKGIGPMRGQVISLAGLWGGGMRTTSLDGWVVHRVAPDWPAECALLCTPESPEIWDADASATMLIKNVEPSIRAVGFSSSGRSLVVATTDLFIWTR